MLANKGTGPVMRAWVVMISGILILGLSAASFAAQQGTGMAGRPTFADRIIGTLAKLNLTEAQNREVALILKDNMSQIKTLSQQVFDARKNLAVAIRSEEYNEAAVRDAAHEAGRVEEEIVVLRAQIMHSIRGVLTPEQKSKLASMRRQFGQTVHERIDQGINRLDQWVEAHSG